MTTCLAGANIEDIPTWLSIHSFSSSALVSCCGCPNMTCFHLGTLFQVRLTSAGDLRVASRIFCCIPLIFKRKTLDKRYSSTPTRSAADVTDLLRLYIEAEYAISFPCQVNAKGQTRPRNCTGISSFPANFDDEAGMNVMSMKGATKLPYLTFSFATQLPALNQSHCP